MLRSEMLQRISDGKATYSTPYNYHTIKELRQKASDSHYYTLAFYFVSRHDQKHLAHYFVGAFRQPVRAAVSPDTFGLGGRDNRLSSHSSSGSTVNVIYRLL